MKKKKILVTTDFIGEGGHSEVLYQTARLLKDEGYEFIVATTRYRSEIFSQEFFRIVELPEQLEGQLQIVLSLIEEEQISLLVDLGLSELVFKIKSTTPPYLLKLLSGFTISLSGRWIEKSLYGSLPPDLAGRGCYACL